jgi:imidazolonepropionase-like amidohydrolase
MSTWEALEAATSKAAAILGPGVAASPGRIETGCLADLVVLDGNPLADLENCRRVVHVIKGGELVR